MNIQETIQSILISERVIPPKSSPIVDFSRVKFIKVSVPYGLSFSPLLGHPHVHNGKFEILINMKTGVIVGWKGHAGSYEFKVADNAEIRFYGENKIGLFNIKQTYISNLMLPGEFNDYLYLDIDDNGKITNWLSGVSFEYYEALYKKNPNRFEVL